MMAASTPDASGALPIVRHPELPPTRRGDGGIELLGPFEVVELPDGAGPELVDDLSHGGSERLLLR